MMPDKVAWKTVQDRYKRHQEWFVKEDNINVKLSGVGSGELGEMNELLSRIREARDELLKIKEADRTTKKEQ